MNSAGNGKYDSDFYGQFRKLQKYEWQFRFVRTRFMTHFLLFLHAARVGIDFGLLRICFGS